MEHFLATCYYSFSDLSQALDEFVQKNIFCLTEEILSETFYQTHSVHFCYK